MKLRTGYKGLGLEAVEWEYRTLENKCENLKKGWETIEKGWGTLQEAFETLHEGRWALDGYMGLWRGFWDPGRWVKLPGSG